MGDIHSPVVTVSAVVTFARRRETCVAGTPTGTSSHARRVEVAAGTRVLLQEASVATKVSLVTSTLSPNMTPAPATLPSASIPTVTHSSAAKVARAVVTSAWAL